MNYQKRCDTNSEKRSMRTDNYRPIEEARNSTKKNQGNAGKVTYIKSNNKKSQNI